MEPRGAVVLLEQAIHEGTGVLVVDDCDHELHGREYKRGSVALRLDRAFD